MSKISLRFSALLLALLLAVPLFAACTSGGQDVLLDAACRQGWLVASSPANGASNIPVNAQIVLQVRDGIDPLGITASDLQVAVPGEGAFMVPVAGSIEYDQVEGLVKFRPNGVLPLSANVTVSAVYGLCASYGDASYAFSFSTGLDLDVEPPSVVQWSPADGETGVPTNVRPFAVFSEELDPLTVTAQTFALEDVSGAAIAGALTYDALTSRVMFTPAAELAALSPYALVLSGIEDRAGNAMPTSSISFTTGEGPDVIPPSAPAAALKAWTRATLAWTAPGNDGDVGTAARYALRVSSAPILTEDDFANAAGVGGLPAPLQAGTLQEFVIPGMTVGDLNVALRAYDEADNASALTSVGVTIAGRDTKIAEAPADRIASDRMAWTMAGNCDINGDGLMDAVAGAPYDGTPGVNIGRAYVTLGKSGSAMGVAGDADARAPDIVIDGIDSLPANTTDYFGYSVTCGDFNGDGVDDVVVGAPYEDLNSGGLTRSNSGAAYLFFGGAHMIPGFVTNAAAADVIFQGEVANDYFGYSVAILGDLDGDGMEDLAAVAASAEEVTGGEGVAYVFYGAAYPAGTVISEAAAEVKVRGEASNSALRKVAPAGDIDGDGFLDIALSTNYPATNRGTVYVLLGKNGYPPAIALATDADIKLVGDVNSDYLGGLNGTDPGFSIQGDLNDDGKDDLVIGAPLADEVTSSRGKTYVFYGRADWSGLAGLGDADVLITGLAGDQLGAVLDAGGDFNADGTDDLLIGAPYFDDGDNSNRGMGVIFYGKAGGWEADIHSLSADIVIASEHLAIEDIGFGPSVNADRFGHSAVFLGDTDGDGYGDVAIGSPYADIAGIADAGGLFVIQ